MVHVSIGAPNEIGYFVCVVEKRAAVTDLSPKIGFVGQEVRIGVTNIDGSAMTTMSVGEASNTVATYDAELGKAHVSVGRIAVTADVTGVGTDDFLGVAPIGLLQYAAVGGAFSLGVTNAAGGLTDVVDTTNELSAPVADKVTDLTTAP
jgi:hypothetical protein